MKLHVMLLTLFMAFGALASDINLGQIKMPAVDSPIQTRQKLFTKIESPIITDSMGRVAKGAHNVFVTVFESAAFPIIVQGIEIKPGETKAITVNLSSTGNRLSIPVYPASAGTAGVSDYRVTISDIRVEVCPQSFTEAKSDCYRMLYKDVTLGCEMGFNPMSPMSCTSTYLHDKELACEDGFQQNGELCVKEHSAIKLTSCEAGYTINGDSCEKYTYGEVKACEDGQKFDGTSCVATSLETADVDGVCPIGTMPNRINSAYCDRVTYTAPNLLCDGVAITETEQCKTNPNGSEDCISYNIEYGACAKRNHYVGAKVCPPGFVDNGEGCKLIESYQLQSNCEAGYTKVSTSSCVKVELIPASAYCEQGYTLSGWGCTKITTLAATPNCASGYYWNGTDCQKDSSATATRNCNSGYYWNGTQCQKDEHQNATGNCSSGYWNGSSCENYQSRGYTGWSCPSSHPYSSNIYDLTCFDTPGESDPADGCPPGYNYQWIRCVQYGDPIVHCDAGFSWDGSSCTRTLYSSPYSYSCPSGWDNFGSSCYRSFYAEPYYTCPSGWSLSGTTCSITYKQAASFYSCPTSDYVLSAKICTWTQTAGANAACPVGYDVVDNRECTRTLTQAAIPTCPSGYTENEGSCELAVSMPATPVCGPNYQFDETTNRCWQEVRVPKLL